MEEETFVYTCILKTSIRSTTSLFWKKKFDMVVPGLIFTNCTLFYQLFSLLERSIIFGSYKMSHISNFYAKYINIYPYYGSSAVGVLYFISMMVFQSFKLMSNKFKDNNIQVNCLSLTNNESVDIYMEMYFSNFI